MSEAEKTEVMAAYNSQSDADLEQLAQDIVAGKVLHSIYHIDSIERAGLGIESIWMILFLVGDRIAPWSVANEIWAVYEYLDKAGPRSVNGMPSFLSARFIDRKDSEKLHKRVVEIEEERRRRVAAAGGQA